AARHVLSWSGWRHFEGPATASIQNEPRRLKQIKALHWQTPARGSFDHQRLFGALANLGALANRITLKTPMVSMAARMRCDYVGGDLPRLVLGVRGGYPFGDARGAYAHTLNGQPGTLVTQAAVEPPRQLLEGNQYQRCELFFRQRRGDVLEAHRVCHRQIET